jgi:hypothetical protein
MAWLNGHQDHFVMVGGQQSTRSIRHFSELFRLADKAGLLRDPEMAVARMRRAARGARRRVMRLSLNTVTVKDAGAWRSASRAARATASPASRPGATSCRRWASSAPRSTSATPG